MYWLYYGSTYQVVGWVFWGVTFTGLFLLCIIMWFFCESHLQGVSPVWRRTWMEEVLDFDWPWICFSTCFTDMKIIFSMNKHMIGRRRFCVFDFPHETQLCGRNEVIPLSCVVYHLRESVYVFFFRFRSQAPKLWGLFLVWIICAWLLFCVSLLPCVLKLKRLSPVWNQHMLV